MEQVFLICDSDALIQFHCVRLLRHFQVFPSRYSLQAVVVPEVRNELAATHKFGQQLQEDLQKAYKSGSLRVLDEALLKDHFAALAPALLTQINSLGADYYVHVDRGEAYTLAAARVLGQPAMSNDAQALRVLEHHGKELPNTVLRVFDCLSFLYQTSVVDLRAANEAVKALKRYDEAMPQQFRHSSFEDGIRNFNPLMIDTSCQRVGTEGRLAAAFRQPLLLTPTAKATNTEG